VSTWRSPGAHNTSSCNRAGETIQQSERLPLPQIVEIGRYKNGFFAISERAYGHFLDRLDENLYDLAHLLYWWPWFTQWRNIDIQGEIERHYQTKMVDVKDFYERL
jgi:hypothetical protein